MPWEIAEREGEFCVVKKADGESVGCHSSKDDALDHMRALYANVEAAANGNAEAFSRAAFAATEYVLATLEDVLAREYQAVLIASGEQAADRWEGQRITAAGKPPKRERDKAVIADDVVDETDMVADLTRRTRRLRQLAVAVVADAAMEAVGLSFENAPEVTEAILRKVGVRAEDMGAAARDAVSAAVTQGLDEGWTVPETADAIRASVAEASPARAVMLARTDLIGLANASSITAARIVLGDKVFKRWWTAHDERVRPTHAKANGDTVRIDEQFHVGDARLDFPGDPDGPDEEVVQCRCVPLFLTDRNAENPVVTAAGWDPAKHPRRPAGSDVGGEFAPLPMGALGAKWSRAEGFLGKTEYRNGPYEISSNKVSAATHTYSTVYIVRRDDVGTVGAASSLAKAKELALLIDSDSLLPPDEIVARVTSNTYHSDELWGGKTAPMSELRFERATENLQAAYDLIDPATDRVRGNQQVIANVMARGRRERQAAKDITAAGWDVTAAAVDFTDGWMVAFYPTPEQAEALAQENGQPAEDLHVTLCFFPEPVDPNVVMECLLDVAEKHGPIEGKVGGIGMFAAGEDGRPVIALPSVQGLVELRTDIARALDEAGMTYSRDYGYVPHLTLAYTEGDAIPDGADGVVGLPLSFDSVAFVQGAERTDVPLAADTVEAAFDPAKHPHEPAGSPKGGQWARVNTAHVDADIEQTVENLQPWMTNPDVESEETRAWLRERYDDAYSAATATLQERLAGLDVVIQPDPSLRTLSNPEGVETPTFNVTMRTPAGDRLDVHVRFTPDGIELLDEIDLTADDRIHTLSDATAYAEMLDRIRGVRPMALAASAGAAPAAVQAAWDETKHPRHPAGSEQGGEFAPKTGGWTGPPIRRNEDSAYFVEEEWNKELADAVARRHGMTMEEYEDAVEQKMREDLERSLVLIRTPALLMDEVVEDGRFKSQHETGTSGGSLAPHVRARAEETMFGYHFEETPGEQRPIYGYVRRIEGEDSTWVHHYGDVTWELKQGVRSRTTFTGDDSLAAVGELIPSPLVDPDHLSIKPPRWSAEVETSLYDGDWLKDDWMTAPIYVEAQIHGGVTLDDVAAVTIPSYLKGTIEGSDELPPINPHAAEYEDMRRAVRKMKEHGITVEYR